MKRVYYKGGFHVLAIKEKVYEYIATFNPDIEVEIISNVTGQKRIVTIGELEEERKKHEKNIKDSGV